MALKYLQGKFFYVVWSEVCIRHTFMVSTFPCGFIYMYVLLGDSLHFFLLIICGFKTYYKYV